MQRLPLGVDFFEEDDAQLVIALVVGYFLCRRSATVEYLRAASRPVAPRPSARLREAIGLAREAIQLYYRTRCECEATFCR